MNSEIPVSKRLALTIYALSTVLVVDAVYLAHDMLELCTEHQYSRTKHVPSDGFFAWDAYWYEKIAATGYQYHPGKQTSIAFFPAFPLAASTVSFLSGIPVRASLLLVSHACLALTFIIWSRYLALRRPPRASPQSQHQPKRQPPVNPARDQGIGPTEPILQVLLAFALFPTTFWFRMAYTESMFALGILLTLHLIEGKSAFWKCCLVSGASTAVRSVGVALVPVLLVEAFYRWRDSGDWRTFLWMPLAVWGLIAFILYQSIAFGEPLAFVKVQSTWQMREVPSAEVRLNKELTLQPLRDVYDPECTRCYWGGKPPKSSVVLNLWFANPIYFFFTAALICFGWSRGWLTRSELLLSACLLFIPYLSHGYNCMASFARYSSAVLPAYIVMGKMLQNMNRIFAISLALLSCSLLMSYSALFANWYWFY